MFQKLKIRLIMINVVLLSIVLLMIFSGMYFIMKQGMNQQTAMLMNSIAKEERILPPIDSLDASMILSSSFFVKVTDTGKTIGYSPDLTVAKEDVEAVKNVVLNKGMKNGNVENTKYKLKFLKSQKSYGFIIVFLDNSFENRVFRWLIIASLSIGTLSLAFVFLISLYLANKALVPIKSSWEKQNAFIADASHELRTPLAVVNSNLEIVIENEEETVKSQSKWLGNVQNELLRMNKLVEDLLFLARTDTDEEEMSMAPFNISNSISQTYEAFRALADNKGLNFELFNKPDIVVTGNEGRIKQLLAIMLDNAIKHTSQGGTIELKLQSDESVYALTIKDSGEGIPKEYIDKIFERFYRVDKSRSRSQGGSGLGLAIAKCIVKEHDGSIDVVSEVGKGTEFRIVLSRNAGCAL